MFKRLLTVVSIATVALVALQPSVAEATPKRIPGARTGCWAIAHRAGPTTLVDENTTAAITRDGELGAWAELDLRRLTSGGMVLMHDRTLKRTTNGWGVVEDRDLAYIQSLQTEPNGQPIPTLDEALTAAAEANTTVYIELKDWQHHRWSTDDLLEISQLVTLHHLRSRAYFGGTDGALQALAETTPELRTFWRSTHPGEATVNQAEQRDVDVVQVKLGRVEKAQVQSLKQAGYLVALLNANETPKWTQANALGIRVIQTNAPFRYRHWCKGI